MFVYLTIEQFQLSADNQLLNHFEMVGVYELEFYQRSRNSPSRLAVIQLFSSRRVVCSEEVLNKLSKWSVSCEIITFSAKCFLSVLGLH